MIQHDDALKAQRSLDRSVAKALERKRRLGQYAVVWRDGKPTRIEPDGSAWHQSALAARSGQTAEGTASYVSLDQQESDSDQ